MYNEALAARIRKQLPPDPAIREMKMMGGLVFMRDGKMFVGVIHDNLMVRVGKPSYEAALARPHARVMDFTGRPLGGFLYVEPAGVRTAAALRSWIEPALAFVATLPAGAAKQRRPRPSPRARVARR